MVVICCTVCCYSKVDLLDWQNLLEINNSLSKLFQVPDLKVMMEFFVLLMYAIQLTALPDCCVCVVMFGVSVCFLFLLHCVSHE